MGGMVADSGGTRGWLIFAALVQAVAAAAVALLTYFLVKFTNKYVGEMARANRLQEQANAISSALLSRASMSDVPFLVATGGGGSGQKGGAGEMTIVLE